ncbi:MAG: alpha/beta fold hydrolase [Actinophytocola sp.]|nr:alpha/beta fold hydrolase [Actinophytocola sp.]
MNDRSATVDGIGMRWTDQGDGEPVVFLHGIPTSPRLWRHVLPLVTSARCLAWEMVGYGQSMPAGRERDISVASQADYLRMWLAHVGIEKPAIVGHDLGGGVAQIFAARHPEQVSGLVLINSICYDSWPIPSVKAMQRMPQALRQLPDLAIYPMFVSLLRRGHDDTAIGKESIREHWEAYETHGAARSLFAQMSALDKRDTLAIASRLSQLHLPGTVIWGVADQFQKLRYGQRLAADLGTELIGIDGGKHFVPEDHPDQVAAVVNDLLKA